MSETSGKHPKLVYYFKRTIDTDSKLFKDMAEAYKTGEITWEFMSRYYNVPWSILRDALNGGKKADEIIYPGD